MGIKTASRYWENRRDLVKVTRLALRTKCAMPHTVADDRGDNESIWKVENCSDDGVADRNDVWCINASQDAVITTGDIWPR